jgi:DNA-binding GntR family transcriptional regulator
MIYKPKNLTGATGKVYQYLFNEIVRNGMKPGDAISEADIAARLQSSRTPVREAMMILESEGILNRYPSRGCFVAQMTVPDVEEIFELRILLELCALRRAYSRIGDEELDALQAKLEALTPESATDAYYETDRELHSLLLKYCGNGRLLAFLGVLNAQIERVRVISASKPNRLAKSRREHLGLVRAIRARDLPQAEKLLEEHIGNVRDSTREVCMLVNTSPE